MSYTQATKSADDRSTLTEVTYTLHGPAVPLTSKPSSLLITTQTFDPPPSAQSTRAGGEPGGVGILAGIESRLEGGYGTDNARKSTKQRVTRGWTKEEKPIPACFVCLGQAKSVHSTNGIFL